MGLHCTVVTFLCTPLVCYFHGLQYGAIGAISCCPPISENVENYVHEGVALPLLSAEMDMGI